MYNKRVNKMVFQNKEIYTFTYHINLQKKSVLGKVYINSPGSHDRNLYFGRKK